MYLLGTSWNDGYLDYARQPGEYRIRVLLWKSLAPIKDLYFIPSRHWRTLFNYLCEIGLRSVGRKVASRLSERLRNAKYVACGLGIILEAGGSRFARGQSVVFLAPCHPDCAERLTLPESFLKDFRSEGFLRYLPGDSITYFGLGVPWENWGEQWTHFAGWNCFSGQETDKGRLSLALADLETKIHDLRSHEGRALPIDPSTPIKVADAKPPPLDPNALSAVLFGYGQYAKTTIIPNLDRKVRLEVVHEIDPCQVGRVDEFPWGCDSRGEPGASEKFDIYFIAGFHHTHGPIAAAALRQGAAAVVEKPLVTTPRQLEDLLVAMRANPRARLYVSFQKRYSEFTTLARRDLNVKPGDPISYHCLVYEVELPALHWYRWPNSGSRILSNGCHWLDHFLFLNDFAPVSSLDVWQRHDKADVVVVVELTNGAAFSMSLTDKGSPRIGVQETVELRVLDRTVRIRNFTHYEAEDS